MENKTKYNIAKGNDSKSYDEYFMLQKENMNNKKRVISRVEKGLQILGKMRGKSLSIGILSLTEAELLEKAGFENTICDISPKAIEYAHSRGFKAIECDIVNSIPPGKYDFVFCFEVLEHLTNPLKALDNLKSTLNTNGVLIISVPNEFHFFRRIGILFGIKSLMFGGHDWHHLRFFNSYYARRLFASSNLKILNTTYTSVIPLHNKILIKLGEILTSLSPSLFSMSIILTLKKYDTE